MSDLRSRIARASLAQGTFALLGKLANLVLGIVLARLLFPEDYGLFAISVIATSLATLFGNFGFQSYLIQAREVSSDDVNACYSLSILLSALLGLVVLAVGLLWPGAGTTLKLMLALYGLHVFVSGLSYVGTALLKRDLEFTRSGRIELAGTLVSMSGRVFFAAIGLGALCFPLGDLAGALLRVFLVRRAVATPRLVRPGGAGTRDVLRFGMHSTSVGLASFFGNQTDKFLLTAMFPVAVVGLYAFAGNAAAMFYNAFIVPQTSVFLATFSRLRDDPQAAREYLAISTRLIFSLALPINILLLLEAERILVVLFTERWLPAAPLLRIFALDFVARSMFSGIAGMQMSHGLASEAARTKWRSAMLVVAALLVAATLRLDVAGYAWAAVVGNLLATAHNTWVNGRLIAVRWGAFFSNLLPPALLAAASTLAWWSCHDATLAWPAWLGLSAAAAVWIGTYLGLSLVFNRRVIDPLWSMLRRRRGVSP